MSPTLTATLNHQVRLAARPVGLPTDADWQHTFEALSPPGNGGVLVKNLALSLDPAMRGWMNDVPSYIPPVALGEVIDYARRAGLIVITDGKRNDIGSTATAYADAYLGADSPWGSDALTVSPSRARR